MPSSESDSPSVAQSAGRSESPDSLPAENSSSSGSPAADPSRDRRILLVDNDVQVLRVLRLFLERQGLVVDAAENGAEALRLLHADRYDLLVCDLDMPVLGGDELLAELERWEQPPRALVISGYVDEPTAERLLDSPAVVDIYRKPFDLRAFAGVVADLVADRRQQQEGDAGGATSTSGGMF